MNWINVKERLPEEGQVVYTYTNRYDDDEELKKFNYDVCVFHRNYGRTGTDWFLGRNNYTPNSAIFSGYDLWWAEIPAGPV